MNESKTHLIIPDQHAHPDFPNDRADLLGRLIKEVKPDVVVNLGDAADMPSLCSYDKGTRDFQGRNYGKDIASHLEFQERMWGPVKRSKKKLPRRVFLEGNHEHRIKRCLSLSPELEGAVSFDDLQLKDFYDDIVEYNGSTPGITHIDGIDYAHYFITGVSLRPISGEHSAHSLLTKRFVSSTCGHTHTLDYTIRTRGDGVKINGLVAGVYQDYAANFAGEANNLWWNGVVIKMEVNNGDYDPVFVSYQQLKRMYS